MMSMVQAAIVAGLEPPKPILEVRVRSAQVRWLLIQSQKYPPVTLGFLPIYHSYGLHFVALRPVWQAIPVVLIPRWNVDLVLDLIPK